MYTFLRARKELLVVDHSYSKYICSDEKPCVVKETNHKIIYDLPTTDYDESKMTKVEKKNMYKIFELSSKSKLYFFVMNLWSVFLTQFFSIGTVVAKNLGYININKESIPSTNWHKFVKCLQASNCQ